MQPNISGKIKLSRGEAYLPHDKGGGAAQINRDVSNQSNFPSGYNQVVASKYVSRFLNLKPAASSAPFNQLSGKMIHEKNRSNEKLICLYIYYFIYVNCVMYIILEVESRTRSLFVYSLFYIM